MTDRLTDPRLQNFDMTGPIRDAYEVTPNDSTDLATPARAIWVNEGGTLRLTTIYGTVVNLTVEAGVCVWGAIRVHSTGTTATGIYAITD